MSSSADSSTPLDFHIEDNTNIDVNTEDCPICLQSTSKFVCTTCIRHGTFCHSRKGKNSETFSEKQLRLLILKEGKNKIEKQCKERLASKLKISNLKNEIECSMNKNHFLKLIIEQKKKVICNKSEIISKLKDTNTVKKTKLQRYEERVQKLKQYVNEKNSEFNNVLNALDTYKEELKRNRRIYIQQLVEYIFPISVVEPERSLRHSENSSMSDLEEACRTVQGKWLVCSASNEWQHRIVAPTLPASGDYSAYNDWVVANKDLVPSTISHASVEFNPAYNISAALTFTTQLVNMLAYYLDVRLPAKLCYSDFCSYELSKGKFMKKVARLNWNILHLCLSQNVEPRLLKPECTLANVLLLLDQTVSDLGRSLTPDVNPEASRFLEDALRPSLEVDDPDDSGDEGFSGMMKDWEAVPSSSGLPEMEPVQNIQAQQISSSSVAGGLFTSTAASIASYLRWNR